MRFRTLQAKAFGQHRDQVLSDLDPGLVVLYAPNEGGKSTWFHLIETLMYGFSPAKGETHPYTPWDGDVIDIGAEAELEDGTRFNISRRLLSTPRGQLTAVKSSENLGNKPLPLTAGITRDMYSGVYSLTLADMQHFRDKTWETVQDRLLSNFGSEWLHPPRQVIGRLETEANGLWRTDRRQSQARQLEADISVLRTQRRQALARYEDIRRHHGDIEALNAKIDDKREELLGLRTQLRRAERLHPVRKRLKRIQELKALPEPQALLDAVPENIQSRLEEIKSRIDEHEGVLAALSQEAAALQTNLYCPDPEALRLLNSKPALRQLFGERGDFVSDRDRHETLQRDLERQRHQHIQNAEDLLSVPWDAACSDALKSISKAQLSGTLQKLRDTHQERNTAEQALAAAEAAAPSEQREVRVPKGAWAALFLGVLSLVIGLAAGNGFITAAGGLLSALGLSPILAWHRLSREAAQEAQRHRGRIASMQERLHKAQTEVLKARHEVEAALVGLPVAPVFLDNPDSGLMSALEGLQQGLKTLEQTEQDRAALNHSSANRLSRLAPLIENRPDLGGLRPEEQLLRLEADLEELEDRIRTGRIHREKLEETEKAIQNKQEQIRALKLEQERLYVLLKPFGPDPSSALSKVLEQKKQLQNAEAMQADLIREIPDLPQVCAEIEQVESGYTWIFSDEELIHAKDREEMLSDELVEMEKVRTQRSMEMAQLEREAPLDAIDSEIEIKETALQETKQKRDRLELLRIILLKADQAFREQHQPDVLRNASEYLRIITRGRYTGLYFDEREGEPVLMARLVDQAHPQRVDHPLSRGTLDQIYLSLRLSLMDHLDQDQETLPLCMDEILVNWDETRLQAGIALIRRIAARRQIYLFTCHRWLADTLAGHLGQDGSE